MLCSRKGVLICIGEQVVGITISGIYVVVSFIQSIVVISTKTAVPVKFSSPFCNYNQIHHLPVDSAHCEYRGYLWVPTR